MTNREWLEGLSDEGLTKLLMGACGNYCIGCNCAHNCRVGVTTWLQQEHKESKKEFTQRQLNEIFKDKFADRRVVGVSEIEETIGELYE